MKDIVKLSTMTKFLILHDHVNCVAHRGSSLFCHSVTYLAYTTACQVVYVIPLAYIDDICELAIKLIIIFTQAILFQKRVLIFTGKLMLPQH